MLYAIIDGKKYTATPGSIGLCPSCGCKMIAKCGEFKSWHWAHKRIDSCDSWYKPETEWHIKWKQIFGKSNSEVILFKNGQKHIADIKTIHGRVIELQNSPIDLETVESRENFYGSDMIWIINGTHFIQNFIIKPLHAPSYDKYTPEFDKFAKMYGFTAVYKPPNGEKDERFQWKRPREVWTYAEAQVYIDFGEDYLFYIKKGLGFSNGIGLRVSKKQFIIDNGGDESLLLGIINFSQ